MARRREHRSLFGTDGIRGRAGEPPMTPEVALQLGRAVAHVFKGHSPHPRIVIGKDTRLSNYMFETALQAGVCSMGVDAVQLGVLPTPGIAFMTTGMRADAGIVISASHNPYEDNGIKFFAADGFKLPDEVELEIERLVLEGHLDGTRLVGDAFGRASRLQDAAGRYSVFLKSCVPKHVSLSALKVVVDCGHGAAYKVAPEVLWELGAEVTALGVSPNGTNINDGAGALYPDALCEKVVEIGADLGIALDGDADRVILCDEKGRVVDGDAVMATLADHMAARGRLAKRTLVATVMSNLGLERAMTRKGITVERTDVGDRYVVERMRSGGFNLGGEQSGHVVMLDHTTTGDGLLTALQVMAIMVEETIFLSDLAASVEPVPQVQRGVKVREKKPLDSLPEVSRAIADATSRLDGTGRVLVRYSGTEAKCRVMLEGDDLGLITRLADGIAEAVESAIGVAR